MEQDLTSAADSIRELTSNLKTEFRTSVLVFCMVALTLGYFLGRWFFR
jgi:hypothetical protein